MDNAPGINDGWASPSAAPSSAPPPPPGPTPPTAIPIPPPPPPTGAPAPPSPAAPGPRGGASTPHAAPLTYRSWQPGIVALRPLSFGDFLTVPFRGFRFNRAVTVGGPTLFTLLSAATTVLAGWLLIQDPQLGVSDLSFAMTGIEGTTAIAIGVAVLSWFAADMFATAIVLPGIARGVLGERISLGQAWKMLVPRIPQLLLLYVLVGVATTLFSALALTPMIIGIAQEDPALTGLGWLLFLGLVFPVTVILGVYLPAARGALVLERVSAVSALTRAFHLMKRRFWWTVLILAVCVAILVFVTNIVQSAAYIVFVIAVAVAPEDPLVMGIALAAGYGLALVLSNIMTYSLLGSVYSLLYIDARMRREGFEVELARAAEARHQPANVVVG